MPQVIREGLEAQLAPYRARYPEARWLAPESWHLTLLFLGSVAGERVGEAIELIEAVGEGHAAFDVSVGRGGGHRSRHGAVAWLGIDEGAGQVVALADDLKARCPDDLALGAPPKRTQSAHLTVARRVDGELIEALGRATHGPIDATWTADRMVLYRSLLSPRGSTYERLHEVTFRPRQAERIEVERFESG